MELLRSTLEAEAELKALRATRVPVPRLGQEKTAGALSDIIQANYQTLIITEPSLCREKDLNAQLWKSCFYHDIERYRRELKECVQTVDSRRPQDTPTKRAAQERLVELTAAFKAFLGKTSAFYNNLLLLLEQRMQQCRAAARWSTDPAHEDLKFCAHRVLIYLGDTARYWEMQAESKRRNWQAAERCYQRALRFVPNSGHAHNQLAVTAMYGEQELPALFHYCLSISTSEPFQTGAANLGLFFKRNKKHVLSMEDEPVGGQSRGQRPGGRATVARFIRLHGILFEAALRHEDASMPGSADEMLAAVRRSVDMDGQSVTEFSELMPSVLDRITNLVVNGQVTEGGLLKIVAVCIFSAHRYVLEDPGRAGALPAEEGRTAAGAYALVLLFSLINRLALLADRYRKLAPMLLTPLVAFSEWVIQHRSMLQPVQPPSALLSGSSSRRRQKDHKGPCEDLAQSTGAWFQPASAEILMLESRARSGMRTSLVALIALLDPEGGVTGTLTRPTAVPSSPAGALATPGGSDSADEAVKTNLFVPALSCLLPAPTRELIELRGFLPVADRIEEYFSRYFFKDFNDLTALAAPKAKQVRLFLLRQFVDKVLVVTPLLTMQVPAVPHEEAGGRGGEPEKGRVRGESRRYPPGSSSVPLTAGRAIRTGGGVGAPGMGGKRARCTPEKAGHTPSQAQVGPSNHPSDRMLPVADNESSERLQSSLRRRRRSDDSDCTESGSESAGDASDDKEPSETENEEGEHEERCASDQGGADIETNDDDDDDDEVIVFKPSFSRYHQDSKVAVEEAHSPAPTAAPTASLSSATFPKGWLGESSLIGWPHFGGGNDMSLKSDPDAERIMECLRLGASSPAVDDIEQMSGGLKPSHSDPCLWSAVAGHDSHAGGLWAPSGMDSLGWMDGGHLGSLSNTPPPVQARADTAPRGPPPGFEGETGESFLCPPPGLSRAEKVSDSEWLSGLQRN